ncbi:FAD-dependent oxidoreductase [Variovorax sp. LT1R16]|uniref:FAD-dependent oxidoreductase n=1 Tax=Variovorax sp. LT1R16 TaxID=3443728 RepID=UPI003F447700
MRVIVLGGGLLGVASAYYLQQLGHEVTVIDRHAAPAAKARGMASAPLRAPPAPPPARSLCGTAIDGLRRRLRRVSGYLTGVRHRPAARLEHMVRLATYSRQTVHELRKEAGVSQDLRSAGWMRVYTDAKAFEALTHNVGRLQALGCSLQLLSPDQAIGIEPSLDHLHGQLAGAAYTHEDISRDPAAFAASLAFMCRAAGVRFLMNHSVIKLHAHEGRIDQVELANADGEHSRLRADAYVLALGTGSVPHARALGIAMPLRRMREYVMVVPIQDMARAPQVMLNDRQGRLRIRRIETPEGERLRVCCMVRLATDAQDLPDSAHFARMLARVETLLPGVVDPSRAEFSSTLHARSASGMPLIGRTPLRNLFLNTAPGAQGWVNTCGAGKSIARIVSGLLPEVEFAFAKG